MRTFKWSIEKERMLQELDSRNGINFADCVVAVDEGRILGILPHPRRKHQQLLVLDIENYAYVVPFVVEEDGSVFLKTVYPSRKLTRMYLAGEKL
ncbi:MAG: toxin [Gammaproteobacteria bacterium]|nr:toxin [Gammaproteobacteria bacterium]